MNADKGNACEEPPPLSVSQGGDDSPECAEYSFRDVRRVFLWRGKLLGGKWRVVVGEPVGSF